MFAVFLKFLPNRCCFKPEPHELVWKSVTAILHRIVVSIFMIFSNFSSQFVARFPELSYSRPNKCVFGPGDVLACPRIYRFVYQSANVPQTLTDPPQKLIVHTFPSIWQQPFFINIFKKIRKLSKVVSVKSDFCN